MSFCLKRYYLALKNHDVFAFQGRSSVCLPLQLSPERLAGWEYSVGVFIALNLAAFLFIMAAYVAIIVKVSKSQRRVKAHGESDMSSISIKRESALARRVFAIILTDFSCWVPVIILSILALTRQFHDEEGFVYVWFAVFVLPVNSSVNPVLYTFSTPKVRRLKLSVWMFLLRLLNDHDIWVCHTLTFAVHSVIHSYLLLYREFYTNCISQVIAPLHKWCLY